MENKCDCLDKSHVVIEFNNNAYKGKTFFISFVKH